MEAVIVAGGVGSRMGLGYNKTLYKIKGIEILAYTIKAFEENSNISGIVVVIGMDDIEYCKKMCIKYGFKKIISIVAGGATRQESVYLGLAHVKDENVLIHDGARALITDEEISNVCVGVKKHMNAVLGVLCKDTLKKCDKDGNIISTIPRENTYCVFTPQGFKTKTILELHRRAMLDKVGVTDDASLLEHYCVPVKMIEGKYTNIKLTTPEDLIFAENYLGNGGVK